MNKDDIKQQLRDSYQQFRDLGGLQALRSGEWLLTLVQRSLRDSQSQWQSAETFAARSEGVEAGIRKLTHATARRAALAGVLAASAISIDEIVAVLTAGEGGLGIPANLAFAAASVCTELFFITRLQVQLVEQIGVLYGNPLNSTNSTDVVTAFAIALGGLDAGTWEGVLPTAEQAHAYLNAKLNVRLKTVARKLGMKLFRRSVVKAAVPVASIAMSASSNYRSTLAVAQAAKRHFARQRELLQVS